MIACASELRVSALASGEHQAVPVLSQRTFLALSGQLYCFLIGEAVAFAEQLLP